MQNNYETGYCKPPTHTQFKPGCSGNKKGRPKGSKSDINDLLSKELNTKVTLKDGTKIPKIEALIKQLSNKGINGDLSSIKLVLGIISKREKNQLGSEFIDKLVVDGYLTEKNIKEYVKGLENLNPKMLPAIAKLNLGALQKRTMAFEAVKTVLYISQIWQILESLVVGIGILEALDVEYSFWEGVDETLDYFKIEGEQRNNYIKKVEKEREYPRPDISLYNTAVSFCTLMTKSLARCLFNIRDTIKGIEGYDEQETKYFSSEFQQDMLSKTSKEMSPNEYEKLKEEIKDMNFAYEYFSKTKNMFSEIDIDKNDVEKTPMLNLFKWYRQSGRK
ncbi:MAG: DUF5681 domain-containing protein [Bacteroidaceae bacterium]|nr:DUF5681 domain-containing protein [Bacteroidaceae bacterium]